MNLLLINPPHSVIDVITNSSTELFISEQCSMTSIIEYLDEALGDHTQCCSVYEINEETIDAFIVEVIDGWAECYDFGIGKWEAPDYYETVEKFLEERGLGFYDRNTPGFEEVYKEGMELYNSAMKKYIAENRSRILQALKGKIVVTGKGDNTLDSEEFDGICYALNAKRYHLG